MDEKEKDAGVAALRERLKNGRINQTGGNAGGNDQDHDQSPGATFQDAGREISSLERNSTIAQKDDGRPGNNQRGADKKPGRGGSAGGRSGEDNSGAPAIAASVATGRILGNIETDDAIPPRKADPDKPDGFFALDPQGKKAAKGKASSPQATITDSLKKGLPWFQGGKLLGKAEAELLADPLAKALLSDFDYIDQAIWGYTQDATQRQLWSDIDEQEAAILARVMTKRGQRSPSAAAAVRGLVESQDYIDVGMIVLPRIHQTVKRVREAPKRERPSRPTRIARVHALQQQQEQEQEQAA